MVQLIIALFLLDLNVWTIAGAPDPKLCAQVQLASSFVETREVYDAAEKKWADDPNTLESFYAFWENRDTCQVN